MSAAAVAEVEVTLDGSLEREMQGKGSWSFVLAPTLGIAKPVECVCTEARGSHSTGTSAGFPVLTEKKILCHVPGARWQHPARLCKPGASLGSRLS